jgi:fructose-bisphosphate aldolase, class II
MNRGNMHGLLQSMVEGNAEKRLDIERIQALEFATGVLMTLHGGSGTNADDLRKAINAGITIVHINTEIRVAWRRGIEEALAGTREVAPYIILTGVVGAVRKVVTERLNLFNDLPLPAVMHQGS